MDRKGRDQGMGRKGRDQGMGKKGSGKGLTNLTALLHRLVAFSRVRRMDRKGRGSGNK